LLWQGRFASCPLDQDHALLAARYVELNPVRNGLVERAEEYAWSSARAHVSGQPELVLFEEPFTGAAGDWRQFLNQGCSPQEALLLRRHGRTGRPAGNESFVIELERRLGRRLRKARPGRKPAAARSTELRSA
jgi:putative transposase